MALKLTPEIKEMITGALMSGNALLLAAVDENSRPLISFRGTTQPFGDDRLALWIRNTQGGTIEAIKRHPHVAMMYRSATTPMLKFEGRARITTDPAERNRIFDASPEIERSRDPDRTGIAIIVDLDQVDGMLSFGPDGPVWVHMAR